MYIRYQGLYQCCRAVLSIGTPSLALAFFISENIIECDSNQGGVNGLASSLRVVLVLHKF